ncbi:MAG: hypothetical protein AB7T27_09565 [Kiritimatiellia bacterium]
MKRILALLMACGYLCGCQTQAPRARTWEEREAEGTRKAVAASRKMSEQPRVMILVDEKSLGTIPTAELEAMTIQRLLDANALIVDQDMVRANISKGQQLLKMAGDNRGAATLGLQFGADMIIVGEVVAKPSARRIADSNLRTYQAVATLRAVRTDNSATVASSSEDASVIGLDDVAGSSKAIKAAGAKSLDSLIPAMLDSWAKAGRSGAARVNHVTITVGGVDQMWKLKAIREKLVSLEGAGINVVQRSYTAGVAIFEMDAIVPIEELSEAIVLDPPADIKFQVLEIAAGNIGLKAVSE